MRNIQRETADKYQEFFNFMSQEHDLILTIEEMDEIVFEAQRLIEKINMPAVVGQSEQLVCDCGNPNLTWYGNDGDKTYFCFECKKEVN